MSKLNIRKLFAAKVEEQKLAILVFGPTPSSALDITSPFHKLALKRIEIRDKLREDGHTADFPEDLLVGVNAPPKGLVLKYEEVLAMSHDLVVILVQSPGSISEITHFSGKTVLAQKTQAFLNEQHKGGVPDDTCHTLKQLGGVYSYFKYPEDLDMCHLLGSIRKLVQTLQRRKLYP